MIVLPGSNATFIASREKGLLTYDYKELLRTAESRNVEMKFLGEFNLFSRLSKERIDYINETVLNSGEYDVKQNFDFHPIGYYYQLIYWFSHFKDSFLIVLFSVNWHAVIISLFVFLVFSLIFLKRRSYEKVVLTAVLVSGFSGILCNLILMIGFQAVYGYLFFAIAFLIAGPYTVVGEVFTSTS